MPKGFKQRGIKSTISEVNGCVWVLIGLGDIWGTSLESERLTSAEKTEVQTWDVPLILTVLNGDYNPH